MTKPLNELTQTQAKTIAKSDWENRDILFDWFEENGFRKIGIGGTIHDSYVWTNNDKIVVKMFKNDDKYIQFVEFCKLNRNNPHLPRISKVYKAGNYYIVFMEKLTRYRGDEWYYLNKYLMSLKMTLKFDNKDLMFFENNSDICNTLKKLNDFLERKGIKYYPDINYDNIMLRNHTIVIIDPIA